MKIEKFYEGKVNYREKSRKIEKWQAFCPDRFIILFFPKMKQN